MSKRKRVRRGAEFWRDVVARQAASGLSVAAFCAREGVSAASFYPWRSRLRAASADAAVSSSAPATAFLDLGALPVSGERFSLRLDLGGGLLLELARG